MGSPIDGLFGKATDTRRPVWTVKLSGCNDATFRRSKFLFRRKGSSPKVIDFKLMHPEFSHITNDISLKTIKPLVIGGRRRLQMSLFMKVWISVSHLAY